MVNTLKLKGRIAEKNTNFQKLSLKVGCTAYTLGRKISNKSPMYVEEAIILSEELDITDNEFASFFLQR